MLKKFAAIAVVLTLALIPVRSAAARSEVCMEFPLWDSGYEGYLVVTHLRGDDSDLSVVDERVSDRIFPGGHGECVSIADIPPGEKYAVAVRPHFAPQQASLCVMENETSRSLYTVKRAYKVWKRKGIWYKAGGSEESPTCAFSHKERARLNRGSW